MGNQSISTAVESGRTELLRSERVAGGMLPRVLSSSDMVAIFVAIVLLVTSSATIQAAGPAAFGWWVLGVLAFLIPGAVVTGQLGVMFPGEGSIYLWTHKAFGDFWGFFAGFCALNMGVEARDPKAITRYLLLDSAAVVLAYLVTTWAVMVAVPAEGNQSVQITAVADVVGRSLGPAWGQLAAVILAGVTGFMLVVYNYSFARLVFVSGLDRRLSMIVMFIDVLVILRRYRRQFQARPLARPAVFWVCAVLGGLSSLVGVISTLSGSQTPLISNDAGSITVLGAAVSYGLWFYLVAAVTLASLVIGVGLYLLGRRTAGRPL